MVLLKSIEIKGKLSVLYVLLATMYYHKYCEYYKIYCSETFTSVKYFHCIFTILVPVAVALLSDIVIVSVTLMKYCDKIFIITYPYKLQNGVIYTV